MKAMEYRKIEVDRINLIQTLETNKKKHVEEYNAAVDAYKDAVLIKLNDLYNESKEEIEKRFNDIKSDFSNPDAKDLPSDLFISTYRAINVPRPQSHEKDYNAAIDMAKFDVRSTLELTFNEFQCFVRDEWDWKKEFVITNLSVSGIAYGVV